MRHAVFALVLATGCATPIEPTIEVSPPAATLVSGQAQQLVVTRHYPGGPFETISDRALYTADNRGVVTVGGSGLVVAGTQTGPASIRVQDPSSDAYMTVSVTVLPPTPAP